VKPIAAVVFSALLRSSRNKGMMGAGHEPTEVLLAKHFTYAWSLLVQLIYDVTDQVKSVKFEVALLAMP
jgi:hypothetical protein